jgi:hypothetical protein
VFFGRKKANGKYEQWKQGGDEVLCRGREPKSVVVDGIAVEQWRAATQSIIVRDKSS